MLVFPLAGIVYILGTILAALAMDRYNTLQTRRALYAAYYGLNPYWFFRK